jgi:hypothetical protein
MNSESTISGSSTALADGELQAFLRRQQKAFRADMSPSRTVREDRLRRLARLIEKPVFVQSRFSGGGIIRPPYKRSIGRVLGWLSHLT